MHTVLQRKISDYMKELNIKKSTIILIIGILLIIIPILYFFFVENSGFTYFELIFRCNSKYADMLYYKWCLSLPVGIVSIIISIIVGCISVLSSIYHWRIKIT